MIVPEDATKDRLHRLSRFAGWMHAQGRAWHKIDLAAYRDHLLDRLASSSASAHLSTIRTRYRELLRDDARRDELFTLAGDRLQELDQEDTPANRKAFVDELVTRLENALASEAAPVQVPVCQDRPDADHWRLTAAQANALMASPGVDTLAGLRDTAVIALMLCTGVREAELCALDVADLRQWLGEELALHVRKGKGCKERLVPYGELSWVLAIVDAWMSSVGIGRGSVFRGLYKGGRKLRPGRLSVRAVQYIVGRYPVNVDGTLVTVRPHDLRRTYARRLYEAGVDLVAIQQNLGHADHKTTLRYIGDLDAEARRAPAVYSFNLNGLAALVSIKSS